MKLIVRSRSTVIRLTREIPARRLSFMWLPHGCVDQGTRQLWLGALIGLRKLLFNHYRWLAAAALIDVKVLKTAVRRPPTGRDMRPSRGHWRGARGQLPPL